MNIVAFGASNSRTSINKKFAQFVANMFEGNLHVLDLNEYEMPIFSVDREKNMGFPTQSHLFIEHISRADLVIISLAEHNGSYSTAFKNIFDWTSRIRPKIFENKLLFLLSTSTGGRGGKTVLETAIQRFPSHGAKIVSSFSLPFFGHYFSEEEGIKDQKLKNQLLLCIDEVKRALEAL